MDCNKLPLNIEKTNFVLFHHPKKNVADLTPLKFGKENTKRAKYVKFLGVLVDEKILLFIYLELVSQLEVIYSFP